jgi:hypothetical protein
MREDGYFDYMLDMDDSLEVSVTEQNDGLSIGWLCEEDVECVRAMRDSERKSK